MKIENTLLRPSDVLGPSKLEPGVKAAGFKDILKNIAEDAVNLRKKDANNNLKMAIGQMDNLDEIMVDMEKADIALQFTMQIRNKVLDAYQEIMRMQI